MQQESTPVCVPLTRGRFALIDAEDAPLISGYRWWTRQAECTYYAIGQPTWRDRQVRMHRLILGLGDEDPGVDHINGDGLDNRRANLRLATDSQNAANRHRLTRNTSGFRGVTFSREHGKWMASVMHMYRRHHCGRFATAEEAARAYDAKARELFGPFARLNFPTG